MNQLGGFQCEAQNVNAIVNGYGGLYFYDGTITDYYTNFEKKLKKITAKNITDIANKMFADNIWGIGFLGTISEKARNSAYDQVSILWK